MADDLGIDGYEIDEHLRYQLQGRRNLGKLRLAEAKHRRPTLDQVEHRCGCGCDLISGVGAELDSEFNDISAFEIAHTDSPTLPGEGAQLAAKVGLRIGGLWPSARLLVLDRKFEVCVGEAKAAERSLNDGPSDDFLRRRS
ncbi:hypothetical protein GCM10012276_32480 [Nocardioides deserti]|nr:hypothetical protein GCM10012276_32480 [Nocardioides deserti]